MTLIRSAYLELADSVETTLLTDEHSVVGVEPLRRVKL